MNDLQLLKGDCLDLMPWLVSDESVDLTVTSPPYDSLRAYEGLPFEKFKKVAEEIYRVTKKGGVVVWVVGDATVKGSETGTSFRQALYFKECGFNLHDTMIYHAGKPPLTHNRYEQKFEYMFVLSKGRPKTFNGLRESSKHAGRTNSMTFRHDGMTLAPAHKKGTVSETKLRGNVWTFKVGGGHMTKDKINHPAIFPESLANDHLLSWSNPGDTVFDPFLGSGTTGKMAIALKRKFIGIEKEEEYFEIAKKRIGESK
jgi:DNA modification methylase